ncbi:DUF4439 domain-containing protein [Allosaccharopolyspora coralli]|uniref:DUF4439 domain-containing protein n=1 Tax=Allosaccharopolyspora coralli TaxID=2665642 RepID=A0A5Q3Q9A0_9PSEU|nr:ferritin-like domain-containing protein [Allosaccharopolyspora coralli]QGK70953.1 DUF4439 domain-containing protein [Allosaccharopolyspora coralli]
MTELPEPVTRSLDAAVAAEHAALWVYGLATAFAAEPRVRSALDEAMSTHRDLRDRGQQTLRDAGNRPPAAAPAYSMPEPVTDQASAIRMLVTSEQECSVGWRAVLDTEGAEPVRGLALEALTATARRATRWRLTVGEEPAAPPFPGQP